MFRDIRKGQQVLDKHGYNETGKREYAVWFVIYRIRNWWQDLPKPYLRMFFEFYFAWYDLWIGAYYSQDGETLYLQLVPMIGLKVKVYALRNWRWWVSGHCATCGRPMWLTDKRDCIPF